MHWPTTARAASVFILTGLMFTAADRAAAQPIDDAITDKSRDAILETRLAYVITGDEPLDTLSAQALSGLSRELYRRTALEPASPIAVNPETDDLSIYPFLYWPISAGVTPLSDASLANVESFMRFGGLILFDTRDAEARATNATTAQANALQAILRQLDIPPLAQIDDQHVLLRSFYLLDDLHGRFPGETVWAQAGSANANDGVTPLIVGGRDWASAWAVDDLGQYVRPMSSNNERAREYAYLSLIHI